LFTERACPDCGGVRLNAVAHAVELADGWTIGGLVECELTELDRVLEELLARDDYEPIRDVVGTLFARMRGTLRHLIDIGVGYLSLNRGVPTLSGGESQRVKRTRELDCDVVDSVYVLGVGTARARTGWLKLLTSLRVSQLKEHVQHRCADRHAEHKEEHHDCQPL